MKLRMLIAGLLIGVAAFAVDNGAELFQKAKTQEQAAGNLEEAIKLYQRVATEFASDRALAAKALVAEAKCYETQGQDKADKATKLYEQVAKDFPDQTDSAKAASARLVVLRQVGHPAAPATMTQRMIELPESGTFVLAFDETDGQRAVFKDPDTGALMMSDLTGRNKRVIFKPNPRAINVFVLSRDSSFVVMVLAKPGSTKNWAVVRTDGTGFREIGGEWTGQRPCDPSFSWDNRYVLYCQPQADGPPQLFRFSISTGEISRIREADGSNYQFSPDARFIAYNSARKIFVVPSQGGEPQLVADNGPVFDDWTRDGLYLITYTTSGGARALNLLPVNDGRQAGKPVFIRYGNFGIGRTTANGAFIYTSTPEEGHFTAWLGKLDSANGSLDWEKLSLTGSSAGTHYPTWSPDSTKVAYITYNGAAGQYYADLRVRALSSGEERDLYHSDLFTTCLWSVQHPNLFCIQRGARNAALSISIETGRTETLGNVPPDVDATAVPVLLTDDDRAVYLESQKQGLVRWEIGATQSTTVLPNPNGVQSTFFASVSPDMRWTTRWENGNIEIRPMSGGDWRPLAPAPGRMNPAFTSDGNWFVYRGQDATGNDGLFRVATSGGQPERIGDFPGNKKTASGCIWISPDRKKIIAESLNSEELWMLQNFEPRQQAAK